MIEIPFVPSTPARFSTLIGDRELVFEQRWNERDKSWYFDLFDNDENPIVVGIKIALGTFMGRISEHPSLVKGAFMAQDTSREGAEAGYDDLGVRVRVWYVTDGELAMASGLAAPPRLGNVA